MAATRAIVVVGLTAVLWPLAGAQQEHPVACTPVKAGKGMPLSLKCNVCQPPPSEGTQWYNITGGAREDITIGIQPENGNLLLADSVQDSAFGGREYECQCGQESECYIIYVIPQVNLTISPQVAKLGSSVSIVCTAESYPPANNTSYFHLFSPHGERLNITGSGSGVEHHIAHVNRSHGGEYSCSVSIEGYSVSIQSNDEEKNLMVYDPPRIARIRSSTLSSEPRGVEPAVLVCEVENKDGLEVWVNWTTGTEGCVLEVEGHLNVFSLVVHNVTEDDIHSYTCQLFSAYSGDEAEDQKTANIQVAEAKNESCFVPGVVVAIISVAGTLLAVIACIGFYQVTKRNKSHASHDQPGSQSENSANTNSVAIDMETNNLRKRSPHSSTSSTCSAS